jgi:hypothetical protein
MVLGILLDNSGVYMLCTAAMGLHFFVHLGFGS